MQNEAFFLQIWEFEYKIFITEVLFGNLIPNKEGQRAEQEMVGK